MLISYKYRGEISTAILLILTAIGQIFFSDNAIFLLYRNGMITLSAGMILSSIMIRKKRIPKEYCKEKKYFFNVFFYLIYIAGLDCSAI